MVKMYFDPRLIRVAARVALPQPWYHQMKEGDMKQKVLPRAIAAVIASAMVAAMPVTALAETKESVSISGKGGRR